MMAAQKPAEFLGLTDPQFAELPEAARTFVEFLAETGGQVDEYALGEAMLSGRITREGLAAAFTALSQHAARLLRGA